MILFGDNGVLNERGKRMSVTSRISPCFGVVILVLAITGSCGHALADQQQANKATARLKALSESPAAPDTAEIRQLINAGADVM